MDYFDFYEKVLSCRQPIIQETGSNCIVVKASNNPQVLQRRYNALAKKGEQQPGRRTPEEESELLGIRDQLKAMGIAV